MFPPLFYKGFKMRNPALTGKKYFYAIGQSARAKGWTKGQGETYYRLECAQPYAVIYFDKGFRGLSMN
jgi:hypothetical protein